MNNIIYVMNVEWNWIKQRPHFIAEKLSEISEVFIVYQHKYIRRGLQKRTDKGLKLIPLKVIPKITGIEKLRWINDSLISRKIKKLIRKKNTQVVFFTYPTQESSIPSNYNGSVYYDCMDNHSAFIRDEIERKKIEMQEKKLIERARRVFVSSEYLKNIIIERYQANPEKFVLVRNAYNGNIINPETEKIDTSVVKLAYIGTLSSWFDFDSVLDVIRKKNNVEFHLYGPVDKVEIPKNPRIIYHGIIEHENLYDAIKHMDCLIMPFVLNEIIKAVDPVKVYEYINFNKNIILREYPEVRRFADFVFFYNDSSEFVDAVNEIEKNRKPTKQIKH